MGLDELDVNWGVVFFFFLLYIYVFYWLGLGVGGLVVGVS